MSRHPGRSLRLFAAAAVLAAAAAAFGQQLAHEVRVVNIEVPVRVFQGGAFVDSLKIEDFEVFENGVRQAVDAVKRAFSDSSVSIHFLFVTKPPVLRTDITDQNPTGMDLVEQSEDIYSAFREVAAATGGLSESSLRADTAFRRAVEAAETYYLVYYKPTDYKADGSFRHIIVKLKSAGLRISHRAGYFAT